MASEEEEDDLDNLRKAALATLKPKAQPISSISSIARTHTQPSSSWDEFPVSGDIVPEYLPEPLPELDFIQPRQNESLLFQEITPKISQPHPGVWSPRFNNIATMQNQKTFQPRTFFGDRHPFNVGIQHRSFGDRGRPMFYRGRSMFNRGQPMNNRGQPMNNRGQPMNNRGQLMNNRGQLMNIRGQLMNNRGQSMNNRGQSMSNRGLLMNNRGQPMHNRGRPMNDRDQHMSDRGRPMFDRGRPMSGRGQFMNDRGRPMNDRCRPMRNRGRSMKDRGDNPNQVNSSVRGRGRTDAQNVHKFPSTETESEGGNLIVVINPELNDNDMTDNVNNNGITGSIKRQSSPLPSKHEMRFKHQDSPALLKLILPQDKYHTTASSAATKNNSSTEPTPSKPRDKFSRYDDSDSDEEDDDDWIDSLIDADNTKIEDLSEEDKDANSNLEELEDCDVEPENTEGTYEVEIRKLEFSDNEDEESNQENEDFIANKCSPITSDNESLDLDALADDSIVLNNSVDNKNSNVTDSEQSLSHIQSLLIIPEVQTNTGEITDANTIASGLLSSSSSSSSSSLSSSSSDDSSSEDESDEKAEESDLSKFGDSPMKENTPDLIPTAQTRSNVSPPSENILTAAQEHLILVDNKHITSSCKSTESSKNLSPTLKSSSPTGPYSYIKSSSPSIRKSYSPPRAISSQERTSWSPRKSRSKSPLNSLLQRKRSDSINRSPSNRSPQPLSYSKRSLSPRRSRSPKQISPLRALSPKRFSPWPYSIGRRTPSPRRSHSPRKSSPPIRPFSSRWRSPLPRRSLSPRNRSPSPRRVSPRRRSPLPNKSFSPRHTPPPKRLLSPRWRSPSPQRSFSPRQRSPLPRRSLTPRSPLYRRSLSPRQKSLPRRSLSPRRISPLPLRSFSPRKTSPLPLRSVSPRRISPLPLRSLSPRQRSPLPPRSLSPRRRSPLLSRPLSPRRRSPLHSRPPSPRRRSPLLSRPLSPRRRSPLLSRPLSPKRRSPLPLRPLSPRRRSLSPGQKIAHSERPAERPVSPRKRSLSPRRHFSSRKSASPTRSPYLSRNRSRSPLKQPASPFGVSSPNKQGGYSYNRDVNRNRQEHWNKDHRASWHQHGKRYDRGRNNTSTYSTLSHSIDRERGSRIDNNSKYHNSRSGERQGRKYTEPNTTMKDNVEKGEQSTQQREISPLLKEIKVEEPVMPLIDLDKLTPEERAKIEARSKKFGSSDVKIDPAKKVSLKSIKERTKKRKKLKQPDSESVPEKRVKGNDKSERKSQNRLLTSKNADNAVSREVDDQNNSALLDDENEDSDAGRNWKLEDNKRVKQKHNLSIPGKLNQIIVLHKGHSRQSSNYSRQEGSNSRRNTHHHRDRHFPDRLKERLPQSKSRVKHREKILSDDSSDEAASSSRLTSSIVSKKKSFKPDIPPEKLRIKIKVASKDKKFKNSKIEPDFSAAHSVPSKHKLKSDIKTKIPEADLVVLAKKAKKKKKDKKKIKSENKLLEPTDYVSPEAAKEDSEIEVEPPLPRLSVLERLGRKVPFKPHKEKRKKNRKKSHTDEENPSDLDVKIQKIKEKNAAIARRQQEIELDKKKYG